MYHLVRLGAALALGLLPSVTLAEEALLTLTMGDSTRTYDRAALEALGETEFTTTTIWTEGPQTFTGVPLNVLLADAGIATGTLSARAINDYAVEIPVDEALEDGPIVAYTRNGAPMSVRDKGPLWLVYPYDSDPAFQTEVVFSRSIWQLDRLEATQ